MKLSLKFGIAFGSLGDVFLPKGRYLRKHSLATLPFVKAPPRAVNDSRFRQPLHFRLLRISFPPPRSAPKND